jgi:hypothetical protein
MFGWIGGDLFWVGAGREKQVCDTRYF